MSITYTYVLLNWI